MLYEIIHRTAYTYTSDVTISQHIAHLHPRDTANQHCLRHETTITPSPALSRDRTDYFGNATLFFTLESAHRELIITARSDVLVTEPNFSPPVHTPPWETGTLTAAGLPLEAHEFVFPSAYVPLLPALTDYARVSFTPARPLLEAVLDLTQRIFTDFTFDPTATTLATPVERVFKSRRGVCQDFAHLQIACLRGLGLPARYVSGYLETQPPPGQIKLTGADASHAWVQIHVPGSGWIDLDPTNNTLATGRHITVAWGRDYEDVSPLRGVIGGGGKHQLAVAVDVIPKLAAPEPMAQTQSQSQG